MLLLLWQMKNTMRIYQLPNGVGMKASLVFMQWVLQLESC